MFGSVILEVAIGMIFLFILISIICSSIREGLEALLKTRAAYLHRGILELLNDRQATGIAKSLYDHPLISSLFSSGFVPPKFTPEPSILAKGGTLPSYIPSKNFAVAMMDIAARGKQTDEVSGHPESPIVSTQVMRNNIMNFDNPHVQRAMLTAIDSAQGDLKKTQQNIQDWFDSSMDRVSGWYKRSTHWILFWIGLIVAIGLNINTITIADHLYRNDATRTAMVARATEAAKDTNYSTMQYQQAMNQLDSLRLPIGWSGGLAIINKSKNEPIHIWDDLVVLILGWLITALAATMGAPFWFDLLNKVMVIRSTVKPHEKSPEESSEDRQHPAPSTVFATRSGPPSASMESDRTFQPKPGIQNIRDRETDIDGCDVKIDTITSDDELPPAQGGVE